MTSLENKNIFEKYYQANYDFNTSSLKEIEIDEIKTLSKEKRVNYALAPIGDKIFDFILEQCPYVQFELVEFKNDKIDGMLYIPKNGDDKAYIILNGNKPLVSQIFAAAHEYYHYIKDYSSLKEKPYICSLSSLNGSNEKKASRFAAELLLPEDALKNELKFFKKKVFPKTNREIDFDEYAIISMILTIKYQLPLKAVIYRLHEEGYINDIDEFIDNYEVIKHVLLQAEIVKPEINDLYNNKNSKLSNGNIIYQQIEDAYKHGLASREEILIDAEKLKLDTKIITSFFDEIDQSDEEEDDTELFEIIKEKWGGE
ncbi:MAG: hypothetical protein K0S61_1419 [Anaerocolumna sp.]|jgi:Zn-dependent peptidase ImmA (M78 family)|nr:hypothetical protein [Anaerocolumna sp.]